jgi:hypothetical protein
MPRTFPRRLKPADLSGIIGADKSAPFQNTPGVEFSASSEAVPFLHSARGRFAVPPFRQKEGERMGHGDKTAPFQNSSAGRVRHQTKAAPMKGAARRFDQNLLNCSVLALLNSLILALLNCLIPVHCCRGARPGRRSCADTGEDSRAHCERALRNEGAVRLRGLTGPRSRSPVPG